MTPNSRSYINRFLQPDTIIPDMSNPQSWNRFSYVGSNPIRFNDPTGHMLDDGDDGGCIICNAPSDNEPDIPTVYGPPTILYQTFHTTFQVHPALPNVSDPSDSYTDFSTGGNPEYTPSLPNAPGQPNFPINDNPTIINQVANGFELVNQIGMGWLAITYRNSPKYAQDIYINYSIDYSQKLPYRNITGMTITNSTQSTLLNYIVVLTNLNNSSPSISTLRAVPGETATVPLPANINSLDYLGGIHVTINAHNTCLSVCWQSQNYVSVAGGSDFIFSPYNP